jgi:hypothetical protein
MDYGGLYYKTLRIGNVPQMDRLCSKLVCLILSVNFTGLAKHTSLLQFPVHP